MLLYCTVTTPYGVSSVYALGNWLTDGTDDAEIEARVDAIKVANAVPSDWYLTGWDVSICPGTLLDPPWLVAIGRYSSVPPPGYET